MKVVHTGYPNFDVICYDTPQEALLNVFKLLLEDGFTHSYGSYYIWRKNDKFFTEEESSYHSASLWRDLGYECYDIVEISPKYQDEKKGALTGFMFNAQKFFKEGIKYRIER